MKEEKYLYTRRNKFIGSLGYTHVRTILFSDGRLKKQAHYQPTILHIPKQIQWINPSYYTFLNKYNRLIGDSKTCNEQKYLFIRQDKTLLSLYIYMLIHLSFVIMHCKTCHWHRPILTWRGDLTIREKNMFKSFVLHLW